MEKERCCSVSCCQTRRELLSKSLWGKKKKKDSQYQIFFLSIFPFSFTLHRSDKCLAIKVHLSLCEVLHNVSKCHACTHTHKHTLLSAIIVQHMLSLVLYLSLFLNQDSQGDPFASEHCDVDQYTTSDGATIMVFNPELHILQYL